MSYEYKYLKYKSKYHYLLNKQKGGRITVLYAQYTGANTDTDIGSENFYNKYNPNKDKKFFLINGANHRFN